MSVYKETDAMGEHRTQCAFKGKREHIAKVNIPNIAYQSQHFDTEIPHGTRHHVIVSDTIEIAFSLDKAYSVVNSVGRTLVKEKTLMLGSKVLDTINKSDIYDIYKDLNLSEKYGEEKLLQSIQLDNGLKAQVGAKKVRWHSTDSDNVCKRD